ncbi:MAG TPA: dTMP kinase [Candidatus Limnocylindrales bacterium]|nr:dTMP kinase [Candidatus Limnocylindrales bacterium]
METTASDGWFVTLEGPEGSGKSTQAEHLSAALRATGHEVVVTREPGGTAVGERIRSALLDGAPGAARIDARTEALLFDAARAQLVDEVVEPAIRRGAIVLCDRFADSTVAYQGYGRGLAIEALRFVEGFATRGRRPDLTILLDLPVELGLRRKSPDEQTRFEGLDIAFHQRVRDGFLALAAAEPERWVVIDAAQDAGEVREAVLAAAVARLPARMAAAARAAAAASIAAAVRR